MREEYLSSGMPDGTQFKRKIVALPLSLVKGRAAFLLLSTHILIIISLPCYAGFLYLQEKRRTLSGMRISTAKAFLNAAANEDQDLDSEGLIRLISSCEDIVEYTGNRRLSAHEFMDTTRNLPFDLTSDILGHWQSSVSFQYFVNGR